MTAWREFWTELRGLHGHPDSWHWRLAAVVTFPFLVIAFLAYRMAIWFDPD